MRRHPLVAVVNHSTVISDEEVAEALPAFQHQATYHFEPHWNAGCTLLQVQALRETADAQHGALITPDGIVDAGPEGLDAEDGPRAAVAVVSAIPAGAWLLVIADDSDQAGALGYHEVDTRAVPLGYVFAKTDQTYGLSWTVTFSHELLEMLGDPQANLTVMVKADGTALAYETADAVEADEDGYVIHTPGAPSLGTRVSNFVLPNWFVPGSPGPWDYRGLLSGPLELRTGGYIGKFVPGKGWTQVTDQSEREAPARHDQAGPLPPIGPRHEAGPRFRMRSEGRGRADHAQADLPAWLEGGAA